MGGGIGGGDRTNWRRQLAKINPSDLGWEEGLIGMWRVAGRQRFQ
jgi:hypothetical protein